jgi:hypothetical protein
MREQHRSKPGFVHLVPITLLEKPGLGLELNQAAVREYTER